MKVFFWRTLMIKDLQKTHFYEAGTRSGIFGKWGTRLIFLLALGFIPGAVLASEGPPEYETTKVTENVYTFRWQVHRNMFVVTDEAVIATDPINPRAAEVLLQEIQKVTDQPVKYVVYSHEHWDHILGGRVFKEAGATFISHEKCVPHFKETPHPDLVFPDLTFDGPAYDLKVGGKTLELRYFGPNHGDCLIVMRLPEEKILFAVDIVNHRTLGYRMMPDYQPVHLIRSLREIEKDLEFDRVIPGHLDPIAPASAVSEQRQYYEDLMAAVKDAMRKGIHHPGELAKVVRLPKYKDWYGYDEWMPQNIERVWAYYHMGW